MSMWTHMKKIILIVLLCFVIALLTGCNDSDKLRKDVGSNNKVLVDHSFRLVTLEENGVIYIMGNGRMAPYYSPNGKLCHYVDGEIVEIGD